MSCPPLKILDWLAQLPYYRHELPALRGITGHFSDKYSNNYDKFVEFYPHLGVQGALESTDVDLLLFS